MSIPAPPSVAGGVVEIVTDVVLVIPEYVAYTTAEPVVGPAVYKPVVFIDPSPDCIPHVIPTLIALVYWSLATNCWVAFGKMVIFAGDIEFNTIGTDGIVIIDGLLVTDPYVAIMLEVPAAIPVTLPIESTVAFDMSLLDHVSGVMHVIVLVF